MRFVRRILLMITLPIMLLGGLFLVTPTVAQGQKQNDKLDLKTAGSAIERRADEPVLHASKLISIPYGFNTPLPILSSGQEAIASGHGGCTADEQVTIEITLTQSITQTVVATGEWVNTCTGELQPWSQTVSTSDSLMNGPAEACGLTTTRDNGEVTDTFEWCKDVDLTTPEPSIYLPIAIRL